MRFATLILAPFAVIALGCTKDPAPRLVGNWQGSVNIHRPPSGNPNLDKDLAKLSQTVNYELELHKDRTYKEKVSAGAGSRANEILGKWSVQSHVVTLNPSSVNGEDPVKLRDDTQTMMRRLNINLPMPEGTDGPKYLTASNDFQTLSLPSIGATAELKKVG